ncbi:MAG: phosphate/phosphite/phosphonate ABC transporter substrate-binding protein [Paracoccaceae bacterium]
MYDRPEIRAETDLLWARLREAIRDRGHDAPEALTRDRPNRVLWSAPELVLGQTCGLPYIRALSQRVGLLGSPAYAIDGVEPGDYRSAIVVGPESRAAGLADLKGARPAVNARDSQSGYGALMSAVALLAGEAAGAHFFALPVMTGSHAASMEAVLSGRAGVAAIDAVSFALALRHDRKAAGLRVIGWSAPTPGLPYITGRRAQVATLQSAVEAAFASLDRGVLEALLLKGFRRRVPGEYQVIRDRLAAAERLHTLPAAS